MHRDNNVRNEMASRSDHRNTSLAELEMNVVIHQSRCSVADEWRQEDERNHYEGEMVVFLKLPSMSVSILTKYTSLGSHTYGINAYEKVRQSIHTLFVRVVCLTHTIGSIVTPHDDKTPKSRHRPPEVDL